MQEKIEGKVFSLESNEGKNESISFRFPANRCEVALKTAGETYNLTFGSGVWQLGETTMLGPSLVHAKAHFAGLPPSRIAAAFRWEDDNTLELTLRYIESPHTERMTCRFEGDTLTIDMQESQHPQPDKPLLKGSVRNL